MSNKLWFKEGLQRLAAGEPVRIGFYGSQAWASFGYGMLTEKGYAHPVPFDELPPGVQVQVLTAESERERAGSPMKTIEIDTKERG